MALATRCPACSTVFRISTAQATAKGGIVRCGQCRHVFNSLDALVRVEDLEVIEEVQVATAGDDATSAPPSSPLEPEAAPDGDTAHASEPVVPDSTEPVVAAPAGFEASPVAAAHQASDDRPAGEWWLPDPADSAATPPSEPLDSERPEAGNRDDAGRLLSGRRTDLPAQGIESPADPAFLTSTNRLGRRARWTLGIGSLVATILLLGQLAYLWRDELAARWSPARPWLNAVCVPLRCTVGYPAHLDWITIESATIQTTGASLDVYVLNALLRNRASSDVRYPHLELVLTDLQDRPILRRALRPEDYLSTARAGARDAAGRVDDSQTGFAADTELPIHLTFELGDLRFAGYRVDKFYP